MSKTPDEYFTHNVLNVEKIESILYEILEERKNQHEKWGEQNLPMIFGDQKNIDRIVYRYKKLAQSQKYSNDIKPISEISWLEILYEEFCEIFSETNPQLFRAEIVQLVAVGVQMIENIDRKLKN
jgi:hypothetical protein